MGIDQLRKVDLHDHGNLFTLAAGLAMGLLPILVNGIYSKFPFYVQMILGNGLAAGTIAAVLINIVFNHVGLAGKASETAEPAASANASRV